ncbi:MAG: hypothetical protein AAF805_10225 [Planctomycetota bacterium]
MPYWLLTSTTYGTWLPGDARGSVTAVREVRLEQAPRHSRREHNRFGDPVEPVIVGLFRSATDHLKGQPVRLSADQAAVVLRQFIETAEHRSWRLVGAAVMANHFHVVVGTRGSEDGRKTLVDLKSYATRALNRSFGHCAEGRWWTRHGSHRRLFDERALAAATNYVLNRQPHVLAKWPQEP